ncbi:MAG: ABC transporter permease [Fimbriimonadaceae bacterium]
MKRLLTRPELATFVLLVVAFVVAARVDHTFLDAAYLLDTTSLHAETALMALGMTLVIVSGNIDLSPAANLALTACVAGKLAAGGLSPGFTIAAAVIVGSLLGAVNGALVAYGRLPSFLVTLATLALYRGGAQALTGPASITVPNALTGADQLLIARIPLPLIVVLCLAMVVGILLHRTIFGRWTYAVGMNESAARFSAVPTAGVKFWCFTLLGALSGISAILLLSRLGVARYDNANGQELDVITAVLLGGASLARGRGTVLGTMLAVALVAVVRTGMGLRDVTADRQLAVIGAMLVAAALANGGIEKLSSWTRVVREV